MSGLICKNIILVGKQIIYIRISFHETLLFVGLDIVMLAATAFVMFYRKKPVIEISE